MYLKGLLMNQNEITAQDRRTLHEWLIKICSAQSSQFASMHQEALHLCIALIDDFIYKGSIPKAKFQLVGITALLLASKQLIYDPPEIQALLNLCENIYSKEDIKQCEKHILKCFDFRLHRPTSHTFVDFFASSLLHLNSYGRQASDRITRHLAVARYCLSMGIINAEFSNFFPSTRARAAFGLASELLEDARLDLSFEFASHSRFHNVPEATNILRETLRENSEHDLKVHPNVFIVYSYP
jgi:hypothetical protein